MRPAPKEVATIPDEVKKIALNKPTSTNKLTGNFNDHFTLGEVLGKGSYATVYASIDKHTKTKLAVKVIERELIEPGDENSLRDESSALMALNHPNVIRCFGFFEEEKYLYMVLELIEGGELFDRIATKEVFAEEDAKALMRNMLSALKCTHDNGYVHR